MDEKRVSEEFLEEGDDLAVTVEELVDAGDRVVALVRYSGRVAKAESRSVGRQQTRRSGPCAMARRSGSSCTGVLPRLSKPPGCRSRPLTSGDAPSVNQKLLFLCVVVTSEGAAPYR